MTLRRLAASLFAALFLSSTAQAANNYFVVVPVKGKGVAPPALDIKMVLNSASLPDAYAGVPYEFDIKPLLVATGDPKFTIAGVSWSSKYMGQGEIAVRPDGVLAGATQYSRVLLSNIAVTASYKGVVVTKSYYFRQYQLYMQLAESALPPATSGKAYAFDFKPLLWVNDPKFVASASTFKLGTAPVGGIALSTAEPGKLIVNGSVPAGTYTIPVTAAYYGASATTNYTLTVAPPGYSASQFAPSKSGTIDTLVNNTGETISVTNCQRTPPGGTATACTAKDAWPAGWPSGIGIQGVNPTNTYRISLANGQTVVWVPETGSVSMQ